MQNLFKSNNNGRHSDRGWSTNTQEYMKRGKEQVTTDTVQLAKSNKARK